MCIRDRFHCGSKCSATSGLPLIKRSRRLANAASPCLCMSFRSRIKLTTFPYDFGGAVMGGMGRGLEVSARATCFHTSSISVVCVAFGLPGATVFGLPGATVVRRRSCCSYFCFSFMRNTLSRATWFEVACLKRTTIPGRSAGLAGSGCWTLTTEPVRENPNPLLLSWN